MATLSLSQLLEDYYFIRSGGEAMIRALPEDRISFYRHLGTAAHVRGLTDHAAPDLYSSPLNGIGGGCEKRKQDEHVFDQCKTIYIERLLSALREMTCPPWSPRL